MSQYGYGYLAHYGVQGMKWGIRNYQNADGTLTSAGKARYSAGSAGKFGSNMLYKMYADGSVQLTKRGSLTSGRIADSYRSRMKSQIKSDLRSAKKSGEISKNEYKARTKKLNADVDRIARKELGNASVNAIKKYRTAVAVEAVAATLTTIGSVAAAMYIYS